MLLRLLEHRVERRRPGLGPRPGPAGRDPGAGRNHVHGPVSGTVVQASHIGHVHIHPPDQDT